MDGLTNSMAKFALSTADEKIRRASELFILKFGLPQKDLKDLTNIFKESDEDKFPNLSAEFLDAFNQLQVQKIKLSTTTGIVAMQCYRYSYVYGTPALKKLIEDFLGLTEQPAKSRMKLRRATYYSRASDVFERDNLLTIDADSFLSPFELEGVSKLNVSGTGNRGRVFLYLEHFGLPAELITAGLCNPETGAEVGMYSQETHIDHGADQLRLFTYELIAMKLGFAVKRGQNDRDETYGVEIPKESEPKKRKAVNDGTPFSISSEEELATRFRVILRMAARKMPNWGVNKFREVYVRLVEEYLPVSDRQDRIVESAGNMNLHPQQQNKPLNQRTKWDIFFVLRGCVGPDPYLDELESLERESKDNFSMDPKTGGFMLPSMTGVQGATPAFFSWRSLFGALRHIEQVFSDYILHPSAVNEYDRAPVDIWKIRCGIFGFKLLRWAKRGYNARGQTVVAVPPENVAQSYDQLLMQDEYLVGAKTNRISRTKLERDCNDTTVTVGQRPPFTLDRATIFTKSFVSRLLSQKNNGDFSLALSDIAFGLTDRPLVVNQVRFQLLLYLIEQRRKYLTYHDEEVNSQLSANYQDERISSFLICSELLSLREFSISNVGEPTPQEKMLNIGSMLSAEALRGFTERVFQYRGRLVPGFLNRESLAVFRQFNPKAISK
jgi:hypothetical protein